jgi:phytoene dehydrogenase-like protein
MKENNPDLVRTLISVDPTIRFNGAVNDTLVGTHSLVALSIARVRNMPADVVFNSTVDKIVLDEAQKRVEGIMINGNFFEANLIFSNMDVYFTYNRLLPKVKYPKKTLSQERSSSAIIFYWGIKKEFPELDLHNIFFTNKYKDEFDAIFNAKTMYNDPTVYINISSKIAKKDAPENAENWFVMVNAPANEAQDWDNLINETRKNVISKINAVLKTNIEKLIETEEILDPRTIESKTLSYKGSLYGTSSNSKFAAFLRHPNFKKNIKGLYFVGGSVHPGGGIPLCLLSAKIATNHV